ncbi:protein-tyrosine phosphatase family protein [Helicovermis profundi]|uniref:Uncharacterized protein n=1 Tax=Helicovermis profundi TaxID=3065157 RepID=A0AAU9EMF1_9FIRM|nr:hypothetical protein HLPR_16100 [Clostridia bacterium S502]
MKNKKSGRFIKILLIIGAIFLLIVGAIFNMVIGYFSGDDDFYKVEGKWEGKIDEEVNVITTIEKGNVKVDGYTYAYMDIDLADGSEKLFENVKFKDGRIINADENPQTEIDLNLSGDEKKLNGTIKLKGKELQKISLSMH